MRMEDVAVPAHAHIVDDIQRQRPKHGRHLAREGDR